MCNAFPGDSEHERDGGSESKVMHRGPFAVGACFSVSFFIHPGIFQIISQSGRGKIVVAIQAQGGIFLVAIGKRDARSQLERGTLPDVQEFFVYKRTVQQFVEGRLFLLKIIVHVFLVELVVGFLTDLLPVEDGRIDTGNGVQGKVGIQPSAGQQFPS